MDTWKALYIPSVGCYKAWEGRQRARGKGRDIKVHFDLSTRLSLSTNTIISSVPGTEDSGRKNPVSARPPGLWAKGQTQRA